MIDFIFSIDGGGTKTKGVIYSNSGEEVASCIGGATNLIRGADKASQVVTQLWHALCDKLGETPSNIVGQTSMIAGHAGAQFENDRKQYLAGLPKFHTKTICTDGYLALIGATQGEPGCLIVVGTGVVGHRLLEDNSSIEIGGWGFPLGDVGGGAWLGWKCVNKYVQWRDNGKLNSSMWTKVEEEIGPEKQDILSWSKKAAPGDYGKLAPIVIEAMQSGDSVANEIFVQQLESINLLSAALKTEKQNCYYAGGLAKFIVDGLNARYSTANAMLSEGSANWGGFLIASGQAPLETTKASGHVE